MNYTAGYGDEPKDIPAMLKMGMIQYAANMYTEREMDALTKGVMQKWNAYKLPVLS